MFSSIPLVFFNPQHKTPLKNLPKLLSLDPLSQGFTHSALLMNIFLPPELCKLCFTGGYSSPALPAQRSALRPLFPILWPLWHLLKSTVASRWSWCPGLPFVPQGATVTSPPRGSAELAWKPLRVAKERKLIPRPLRHEA